MDISQLCQWLQALAQTLLGNKAVPDSADSPLIPRSLLVSPPDHSLVHISPDGRWISWIGPGQAGVPNLWLQSLETVQPEPKIVTSATGRGIEQYYWAYDNKSLLYLEDKSGEEKFWIYRYDINTSMSTQVVQGELADKAQMLFVTLAKTCLSLSPKRPNQVLVGIQDGKSGGIYNPYLVSLQSGEVTLIQQNPGYASLVFDQDLNIRIGSRYTADGTEHFLFDPESKNWSLFKSVSYDDNAILDFPVAFDSSGEIVQWADTTLNQYVTLVRYNLTDNSTETILTNEKSTSIRPIFFHPITLEALASFEEYTTPELTLLYLPIEEDIATLRKSGNGLIVGLEASQDLAKWIVQFTKEGAPIEFYLYDREKKSLQKLFSERGGLANHKLSPIYPIEVETRDGKTQVCYMTYPASEGPYNAQADPSSRKPISAVMLVHGGPYSRDNYEYNEKAQLYANRGYAVFQCNFRGSIGYGKDWIKLSYGEWGGTMHSDILDAANWAVKNGIADSAKIALTGHSYGGYETLFGIGYSPDIFACAVAEAARSNLSHILDAWPQHWPRKDYEKKLGIAGLAEPEARSFLIGRSPLTYANNVTRPILIGQGENDPRVLKEEPDWFVAEMKKAGLKVGYMVFPGEGHEISIPEHKIAAMAIIENFLANCLGGRAEKITDEVSKSDTKIVENGWLDFLSQ